jgi:hypothetical protein
MTNPTFTTPLPVPQYADLARRGQDAATTAVESWTDALQTYADAVTPRDAGPVDPRVATEAAFDLAERLLGVQRALVTTAVTLLTEAAETAGEQATKAGRTLKAQTDEATERVIDLATEATRRAAAAARNGVSA